MTEKEIKRLEELNESWANDPLTPKGEKDITQEVMDLLPKVLEELRLLRTAHTDLTKKCGKEEK